MARLYCFCVCRYDIYGKCSLLCCGVVAAVGRDLRLREVVPFRCGVVGLSHCGSQLIRLIRLIRQ